MTALKPHTLYHQVAIFDEAAMRVTRAVYVEDPEAGPAAGADEFRVLMHSATTDAKGRIVLTDGEGARYVQDPALQVVPAAPAVQLKVVRLSPVDEGKNGAICWTKP